MIGAVPVHETILNIYVERGMSMPSVSIRLEQLEKSYRTKKAVHDLNLEVHQGELFGFLGPNGAGKTTTIKMMTGLLEPTKGTAEIGGINIWEDPVKAKGILAYVPDQPNIYPKLTGWDYLEFIASVFQLSEADFRGRAEELLHTFDLIDRVDELIESYSHGMRQKIAICGALLHQPKILFLDEPTVGLDPQSARNLKRLLLEHCERGMTVFLTTHILEIAEQMCDRIGIISEGALIALGTMDELRGLDGHTEGSLEDIFLELTGGEKERDIIAGLAEDDAEEQL